MLHGILDVESVGLHGEGFAAALAIADSETGRVLEFSYFGCPSETARGTDEARAWIEEHVVPYLPSPNLGTPYEVRQGFWEYYTDWRVKAKSQGVGFSLWADCGFPVEDRFLLTCIDDSLVTREWEGPYPLQEIASIRTKLGLDPVLAYDLPPEERHNPVSETIYIAERLLEWLK